MANQEIHQRRLRIEHVTSSVKRWRSVKDRSRLWKEGARDLVRALCYALHNVRVRLTPVAPDSFIRINSILQGRIVELKLPLEGAVGQATALAQRAITCSRTTTKSTLSSPCLGARPPCSWQDHHSTRDRKRAARSRAVKSGLRLSVTGLGKE